mgnify:CR=1 FL=1
MKNKVAIIGVGTQGSMIAFRNAVYGKEVTAYSRNLSSRERCAERIERFLEFYVQTGRLMQAEADIVILPGAAETIRLQHHPILIHAR